MKARSFMLGLAGCLAVALTSCDRDGNTGNGANDPTDQFESDKVKKAGDHYGAASDTTAKETTTLNTVDTTMAEGSYK